MSSMVNAAVLAELPMLRAEAEARMTAHCVIRRPDRETVTNPDFTVTTGYDTVYTGRCRMQTYEGHEQALVAGAATHVVQRSTVHLPVGVFQPLPGDIVTITAEPVDPLLVGRHFRVVQQYPVKSHMTAYRVFVDENITEPVPPLT